MRRSRDRFCISSRISEDKSHLVLRRQHPRLAAVVRIGAPCFHALANLLPCAANRVSLISGLAPKPSRGCFAPQECGFATDRQPDRRISHSQRRRPVSGASWRYDPLGPAFAENFFGANRFLQIPLALPGQRGSPCSLCHAIPLDFTHAPSPRKPSKKPPESEWAEWRKQSEREILVAGVFGGRDLYEPKRRQRSSRTNGDHRTCAEGCHAILPSDTCAGESLWGLGA